MPKQVDGETDAASLVDHLEMAHEHAADADALYHIRAALQLAYCEESETDP